MKTHYRIVKVKEYFYVEEACSLFKFFGWWDRNFYGFGSLESALDKVNRTKEKEKEGEGHVVWEEG